MKSGGKGGVCEAWRLLFELLMSHRARVPSVAAEFELSEMQCHVLRLVPPGGGVAMGALARSLECDASNVTGIVDRLEARGLLERRPSEQDRRIKVIVLTSEGAALRGRLLARLAEPPDAIAQLSADDQAALTAILRRALVTSDAGCRAVPGRGPRGRRPAR